MTVREFVDLHIMDWSDGTGALTGHTSSILYYICESEGVCGFAQSRGWVSLDRSSYWTNVGNLILL